VIALIFSSEGSPSLIMKYFWRLLEKSGGNPHSARNPHSNNSGQVQKGGGGKSHDNVVREGDLEIRTNNQHPRWQ